MVYFHLPGLPTVNESTYAQMRTAKKGYFGIRDTPSPKHPAVNPPPLYVFFLVP